MRVGIDKLNFFVPSYFMDMTTLAEARNVDPNKFLIGIGQSQMAVAPKTQDIVTFAMNAALPMLSKEDKTAIDMIIVGTESSIDESKASAVVLHRMLNIQPFARSFEIKEACYGATAGVQMALSHVQANPKSKVLVIASDNARYGLHSAGEPTQGAGAVAILIAANPRIVELQQDTVALTQDIYDFWRPVGHEYPLVEGALSNQTYIESFQKVWTEYKKRTQLSFEDFAAITFHVPYTKMGKKAIMSELEKETAVTQERLLARYEESIAYSRRIGNLYTGSLYLSVISLLEQSMALSANDRIGFFSYGSGAVAEFFSGRLVSGYKEQLNKEGHEDFLDNRHALSLTEYETFFTDKLIPDQDQTFSDPQLFSIQSIEKTIRTYKEI
ncbi:hydroxymethylglutaryl-CoA synthase [uncultured Enterococcus sp.]|uniref:hydroxymethylglutaryl-CoA synthase n=1 Tax=uncultured Enterococcus sp. TaxID=167972 RepID=UPI0025EAE711|nr:hydroxymethylglutaryl-CoA synthase [uncultured Enterococcus sp.]